MNIKLKPIREQAIVLTGASSGIGLSTARKAAREGARLVLAARNEQALREIAEEIRQGGGNAHYVVADVASEADMRRVAAEAVGQFGGYDTWVNNAGVSIYGRTLDVNLDDARRLFETNFWGLVYGSFAACEHLRQSGGALINIGSVVSDTAVPLQGFYSASKHAVKGFTDALRMELEEQKTPISITLIKPGPIDTPFTQHAKNLLGSEPQHAPPVYDPELVADAILHAAQNPVRDLLVGGGAKFMSVMGRYAPRLTDKYMENVVLGQTESDRPRQNESDSLHSTSTAGEERGDYPGMVRRTSAYTTAAMHPMLAGALGIGASVALGAYLRHRSRTEV